MCDAADVYKAYQNFQSNRNLFFMDLSLSVCYTFYITHRNEKTFMKWEFAFLYFLQDLHSPLLDSIMLFFTKMGNVGMPWLALAAAFLCFKKTRKWGIAILGSMLLKELIGNLVLKNLVARSRPCWIDTTVPLLISSLSSYSFPSGHTFDAFAASVSIFLYNKKVGIAAILVGAIISFSRMYLFVHFPTDVLASIVLGIVVAVFVHSIVEKFWGNNIYKIERTI